MEASSPSPPSSTLTSTSISTSTTPFSSSFSSHLFSPFSGSSSSSFSASLLPVALLTLVVYAVYRFFVYPLYLSPLARIPNAHWSSAISPLWILYVRYTDCENETLLEAHQKLGPVVRLGPNDVSIDDIDHVKTVYLGGFSRTDWYGIFDNYGVPCMFSTISGKEHATRKRMVSHVYSKSFIQGSPAVAGQARAILLDRLLPILTASAAADQEPHGVEVFALFLATSMDFVTAHVYGLRGGTNFLRQPAYRDHWLQMYLARFSTLFFRQELPGLTRLLTKCGVPPYSHWMTLATDELAAWNRSLYEKTAVRLGEEAGGHSGSLVATGNNKNGRNEKNEADSPIRGTAEDEPTVMKSLLAGVDHERATHGSTSVLHDTVLRQPVLSAQSELLDHIIAGHETTAIALNYLSWQLSLHQDVQDVLRNELLRQREEENPHAAFFPDAKSLDALPVMHAVIMETLRLYAPFAAPQPRQTPPNGCHIGPYELPGGVRIAALAHTLHREASIFPDPETWDYTRWLDGDGPGSNDEAKRARARQFWAFGSGGRMCIGSNFAMHEMKAVLSMIYSRFRTHVVDDSGMDPMDPADDGTSQQTSERLYLRFEPLQ